MPDTKQIILLIDPSAEYDRGLLRGIAKYSRLRGQWSFSGNFGVPKEELIVKKNFKADGILARHIEDIPVFAKGIPTVVCKSAKENIPGLSSIDVNSSVVGEMAAEHLFQRGFKYFAYCGRRDKYWSHERGESFCEYAIKAGFDVFSYKETAKVERSAWDKRQSHLFQWLKSLPKPVGLMACNDNRAQHVLTACRSANLRVPDEVAVIGVDDDELICNLSKPSLSSVQLNFERAGYEAAQHLDSLIMGKEKQNRNIIVNPVGIRTRESTDILAIEDRELSMALRFIRENFDKPIRVDSVCEHVSLSRRALELKFKKQLKRSINSEIRRVRVQHACSLLIETNIPIKKIASELGYPDTTHIARYFKIEKGMSLQAYRELYGQK